MTSIDRFRTRSDRKPVRAALVLPGIAIASMSLALELKLTTDIFLPDRASKTAAAPNVQSCGAAHLTTSPPPDQ